jgi:hypothetical protein
VDRRGGQPTTYLPGVGQFDPSKPTEAQEVAKSIGRLAYAEKRDRLIALDVRIGPWRADREQRREIATSLPLDVSTTSPVANAASSR